MDNQHANEVPPPQHVGGSTLQFVVKVFRAPQHVNQGFTLQGVVHVFGTQQPVNQGVMLQEIGHILEAQQRANEGAPPQHNEGSPPQHSEGASPQHSEGASPQYNGVPDPEHHSNRAETGSPPEQLTNRVGVAHPIQHPQPINRHYHMSLPNQLDSPEHFDSEPHPLYHSNNARADLPPQDANSMETDHTEHLDAAHGGSSQQTPSQQYSPAHMYELREDTWLAASQDGAEAHAGPSGNPSQAIPQGDTEAHSGSSGDSSQATSEGGTEARSGSSGDSSQATSEDSAEADDRIPDIPPAPRSQHGAEAHDENSAMYPLTVHEPLYSQGNRRRGFRRWKSARLFLLLVITCAVIARNHSKAVQAQASCDSDVCWSGVDWMALCDDDGVLVDWDCLETGEPDMGPVPDCKPETLVEPLPETSKRAKDPVRGFAEAVLAIPRLDYTGLFKGHPSRSETRVQRTPAEETPAEETPAEETPAKETPAKETPAKETQMRHFTGVVIKISVWDMAKASFWLGVAVAVMADMIIG
ncbi:uncharacterized protein BKCO1_5300081 [Diplodia corticola]|uniref:Uncharacterized protein n=1 Tax=Diplodia corticola TaxID=236234 RepID=A0A1J9QQ47_9PEZI|nr:uncharacterized protein BKCO1_5300081 [Diplodia corticola]OJD31046.1 hypothetical protein BKCO1_5300081 [Diplodia corticola]